LSNRALTPFATVSRRFLRPVLLLLLVLRAEAQVPLRRPESPPPWIRYNEDYSFLADPTQRTDRFDFLKYISLGDPGYLSLGGEARERFESYTNETFNSKFPLAEKKDDNSYFLQRYLFHADYHPNDWLRVFGQLQSSLECGRYHPRVTDRDAIDLHQMFADLKVGIRDGGVFTLRVGRQEMSFGAERLVGVREGPNNRRAFDAVRVSYKQNGVSLDTFISSPVEVDPGQFDDQNVRGVRFWGTYATIPCPRLPGLKLDFYYFGLRKPSGRFVGATVPDKLPVPPVYVQSLPHFPHEERHTLGTRLAGTVGNWDMNNEALYQFGQFGSGDIQAFWIAADDGYTFKNLRFQPRLGLRAGIASGDNDPNNGDLQTVNPLFVRGNYFSEAGLLAPQNLMGLGPNLRIKPDPALSVELGCVTLWRESLGDTIYRPPGIPIFRAESELGRYVGTELIFGTAWRATPHIGVAAAYSHFFAGDFIEQNNGDDADFGALWLTFRF
jgi:Alginate export